MSKNIHALLTSALLVASVSCSLNETDTLNGLELDSFYATIEQPADDSTKVYADQSLKVLWDEGDHISIFNLKDANDEYYFTGQTGDNGGTFELVKDFSEEGVSIDKVYAVYPYSQGTSIDRNGAITFEFPVEQHYRENSFGPGANLMVSVSKDKNLQFKNACGYLRLSLYGEDVSVSSITLKGNNGETLAGKATVTMPLDGTPSILMSENATKEITLVCDTPVALGAIAEESVDFWLVVPPTTFSKGFTVTVREYTGEVIEGSTGKNITIKRNNLSKMSPLEMEGRTPAIPIPEAVDLGLPSGLKWASFNLGASKPEEYGDYYAWGETEPYYSSLEPLVWKAGKEAGYDWPSYKWCMGAENTLTKYCNNSHYGYNGFTDGKTTLDQEDDAAYVNLGDKWRMPSMAEWTELRTNCTWTADVQDGVWGYIVKSLSNGKHIFLPMAGELRETRQNNVGSYGYYWSSSLYEEIPRYSQYLFFIISAEPSDIRESYLNRYLGNTIRPVYAD